MTSPLLKQTWVVLGVLINMFGLGLMLGYNATLMPGLHHPDSDIKADINSISWIVSISYIAGIPGFLLSSILMALYGRKFTHGLSIIPGVVGWVLIYLARDVPMLLVGRFLNGVTAAATVSLGAIMIGECTSPAYRGVFLYLKNALVCIGTMVAHIISLHFHWRTIALVSLTPLVIAFFITLSWCESPAWLASKHRYVKSQQAFYWLRGYSETSRREIEEMIRVQKYKRSITNLQSNKMMTFFRKFTQKDFLKPTLIMILATVVLEMTGRHIYPSYVIDLMYKITGETSHFVYYVQGVNIIITTSALFSSILVKVMKRRTLLFSTGLTAIIVLIAFCLYLLLASKDIVPNDKPWIPVCLVVLYFILANLGCVPLPLALVGEVFPLAHREVGSALSGIWMTICLMMSVKSAPHLFINTEIYGFFFVYGSIMGVCLLVLYFIMPETKDRTLQEIENYFNYGKYTNDVSNMIGGGGLELKL